MNGAEMAALKDGAGAAAVIRDATRTAREAGRRRRRQALIVYLLIGWGIAGADQDRYVACGLTEKTAPYTWGRVGEVFDAMMRAPLWPGIVSREAWRAAIGVRTCISRYAPPWRITTPTPKEDI